MPYIFMLIFFAAIAGVVFPYLRQWKRKHFALAAAGAFIGMMFTVPKPTAQERAARKAAEAKEATQQAQSARATEHTGVLAKAAPALEVPANYTRAEYGTTYKRVGATSFAKLNELEAGAVYAAAESKSCDKVVDAAVSDRSKRDDALWYVNCANENRFMVSQKQAADALARFKEGNLASRKLDASCTLSSVAMCGATSAQRAALDNEVALANACDFVLDKVLVSPSSLDMVGSWSISFGKNDSVTISRNFDSQNSFGAMIRSRYRCTINAATSNITGFVIEGPTGTNKVI